MLLNTYYLECLLNFLSYSSSLDWTKEEDSSTNASLIEEEEEEIMRPATESSDEKILPPEALLSIDDEPTMTDLLILAAFGIFITTLRNYLYDLPLF